MDFTAIKLALEGISDLADGVNASFHIFTDLPKFLFNIVENLIKLPELTATTSSAFEGLSSTPAEVPAGEAASTADVASTPSAE